MAGGTWKKATFITLAFTIVALIVWIALRAAKAKQPDNDKLAKANAAFLGLWIGCLVLAVAAGGLWAVKRGGGASAAVADSLTI